MISSFSTSIVRELDRYTPPRRMSSPLGTLRLEYSFPHIHENHPWDVLNGTVYVLFAGERVALYYVKDGLILPPSYLLTNAWI
jgi:hypothetical protein